MRQLLTHPTQVAVDLFDGFDLQLAIETLERLVIEAYLIETEWNVQRSAKLLMMPRTTLDAKMRKFGFASSRKGIHEHQSDRRTDTLSTPPSHQEEGERGVSGKRLSRGDERTLPVPNLCEDPCRTGTPEKVT